MLQASNLATAVDEGYVFLLSFILGIFALVLGPTNDFRFPGKWSTLGSRALLRIRCQTAC